MNDDRNADTPRKDALAREDAAVELVRLDYDASLRAMNSIISTGGQIRAIGIAAWGLVLSLAVRDESLELALLATILVAVFAYSDAYHAALYGRILQYVIKLETILDSWLNRLGIDADDPDAVVRARAKIEMHRFGVHRNLRRPRLRDMVRARPRPIFWGVYPALLAASLVAVAAYSCS
jgi:hypothetical protein